MALNQAADEVNTPLLPKIAREADEDDLEP